MFEQEIIENQKKTISYLIIGIIFLTLFILGGAFNVLALKLNDGKMPVLTGYDFESNIHFSFQDKSQIKGYFFVDRLKINIGKRDLIFSIGDIIIIISFFFLITYLLLAKKHINRTKKLNIFSKNS